MSTPCLARAILAALGIALLAAPALAERSCPVDRGSSLAVFRSEADRLAKEGAHEVGLACYRQALERAREGDARARIALRVDYGAALERAGEFAAARTELDGALRDAEQHLGAASVEAADAARHRGWVSYRLGNYAVAEADLRRALETYRARAEGLRTAKALNSLGAVYRDRGAYVEAERAFGEALAISQAAASRDHEDMQAGVYNGIAGMRYYQSDFVGAIAAYEQAGAIFRRLHGDRSVELAQIYNNLGYMHQELGQLAAAERSYEVALAMKEALYGPRHAMTASTVNNLGDLAKAFGRPVEARSYYDRALAIYRETLGPDHPNVAIIETSVGELEQAAGRSEAALEHLEQALRIRERALGVDSSWIAETLIVLAPTQQALGQPHEARASAERALAIALLAEEEKELLWKTYAAYARTLAAQGALAAGIFFGKQSANLIQELRAEVATLGRPTQRSFLAVREPVYRELADALITAGRLPEAQQVLDMLKEEEYSDFLRTRAPSPDLDTRATLTAHEIRLAAELRAEGGAPARTEALRARLRAIIEDAERDASRTPTVEAAAVLSEAPPAGTTRIRYVVLRDRLRILGVHAGGSWRRDVELPAHALNQQVFVLRQALQQPDGDARKPASAAYRLLFEPFASELVASGTRRLELVLDGTLRYLPFAALFDGRRFLLERYTIVVRTPAAQRTAWAARAPPDRVAAFGVAEPVGGFAALPRVSTELDWIVKAGPGDRTGVFPGIVALDHAFTAAQLRAAVAQGYPAVHLASHFVFRPGAVDDSFLLLGGGERLTLGALRARDYSLTSVKLLTLSACETALGEPNASGLEFESFSVLAQRQGAAQVLATFWPVADVSTAMLMARVYRGLGSGLAPADALREAQLAFLSQRSRRVPPRYRHPYYWAGYVASGS